MPLELLGVEVHDPDVVITDLGLALLGAWLARRLWAAPDRDRLRAAGALVMGGLAVAALAGAIFHGFFPGGTAETAGFLAWMPVPLAIAVVAATLLALSLALLVPPLGWPAARGVAAAYGTAFALVAAFVDESFGTIVRFYGPALALFLAAATLEALRRRDRAWGLVAAAVLVSGVAAVIQQAGVTLHPVWMDHNALYHVVQAVGLVLLYRGFRGAPAWPARG